MNTTVAIIALVMTVLSVLLAASALIIKSLRDGSLQADIRWTIRYIKLYMKNQPTN